MISSALLVLALAALRANGSPVPQGVTALISPSGPIPSGCALSYDGLFAIAAIPVTGVPIPTAVPSDPQPVRRQVKQQSDGQPTVASVVSQISDAQPQAPSSAPLVTQISDAQPQAPKYTSTMMHTAVSQIGDGQVQVIYTTLPVITQISDAQPQAPKTTAVISQISDAQPQAPKTTSLVSQISDAQPQAPKTTSLVSQISDAQPQAPSTTKAVSQISDAQPQATTMKTSVTSSAPAPSVSMVACKTNSTLELDLKNGRLLDGKGRVGYIAANFQFQFDAGVPQTGALFTAGFSVCSNDTLALGGTTIFWKCLSGDFYNLYDRFWAAQCSPVNLRIVGLKDC